jgi:hypothetical protein
MVTHRLQWADRRLDELKDAVEGGYGIYDSDTARYSIDCDMQTRDHVYRAVIERQPALDISFLLSDVVHNLRASLDNLLWAIVAARGNVPPENLQFPMCYREDEFWGKRWLGRLQSVPDAVFYAIEDLQPYKPRYSPGTGSFLPPQPRHSPLAFLNVLSNRDKHRAPHLAWIALYRGTLLIKQPDEGKAETVRVNTNRLQDGDEFLRIRFAPPNTKPDVQPGIGFDVAFDERSGMMSGDPVLPTIIDIRHFVHNVTFPILLPFLQD